MRYIFIFLWFFSVSFTNAQSAGFDPDIIIKSSIDTTNVKIGEEIIYTIDIESNSEQHVVRQIVMTDKNLKKFLEGMEEIKVIYIPNKLINFVLKQLS